VKKEKKKGQGPSLIPYEKGGEKKERKGACHYSKQMTVRTEKKKKKEWTTGWVIQQISSIREKRGKRKKKKKEYNKRHRISV